MVARIASRSWLMVLTVVFMAAPAAMAQRPYGADFAHWDDDLTSTEWTNIYNQGLVFCYTKATDGLAGLDWTFTNNMERGRAAGVLLGAFHMAHPETNTAVAEADYFVTAAGNYISNGYLRPALDLEYGSGLSTAALSQWVNDWMNRVQQLTGVEPILYTSTSWATSELDSTVADRDLWIAEYTTNPNPQTDIPDIGVFNTWIIWQYTAHGRITGLTGGAIDKDLDVFNGVLAGLQNYVISGIATPLPSFVVESRTTGQHYANYSETGTWADATAKSTAPGCTVNTDTGYTFGSRYCSLSTAAKTAVFSFTPALGGTYEVFTTNCSTSNSGNPLVHRVTHAGGTATINVCQNTTCGTNAVNKWFSLGQYTLNAGTAYTVTLDGSTGAGSSPSGNVGRSDAVRWQAITLGGPTITQQPAAQNVCSGTNASFTVAASGQGTLYYQWQKNAVNLTNGGHYSGCASTTLAVTGADSTDLASFRCAVTDSTGTTYSNTAALTLKTATAITTQPQNQSVGTGGTATFTVAASGSGTLTYQWQKNSANLTNGGHYSGCTTATLTISGADSNDAANYCCVVTGDCGSATSSQASLTIQSVQTILSDNFDSYATQAAFQTAWPAAGTTLTLSTTRYYSSPKSVYSASGSTAYQNKRTFTETYGTDASPLTLQFRMYDGGGSTGYQWVELRDYSPVTSKQLIEFGYYSGSSTTYYAARVTFSPGNNWAATSVARSTGWHLFKIVFKSTTCDFYVDGVLASANRAYAASEGAVSFEEIRVGSNYGSTSVAAYYDDVLLTKGQ